MAGILVAITTSIVGGLITSGLEAGAGWVLKGIEGDTGQSESEALAKELNYIEGAVSGLQKELAKDTALILTELKVIQQQQLYQSWETRDNDLQDYITKINVQYTRFLSYAKNPDTTSKADVANLVTEILDSNSGAEVSLAEINTLLKGSGPNKGVLQLYREMTEPIITDSKIDGYDALNSYFQYFMDASYAQCRALYLLIEAFHYQNNNGVAEEQYDNYRKLALSQELPFISNVQYFLRGAILGGIVKPPHAKRGYTLGLVNAYQDFWGQSAYVSGYTPTAARAKAERIFSNSLALKNTENRVVINMVYQENYGTLKPYFLDSVHVPIVSASQPSAEIQPTKSDVIKIPKAVKAFPSYNTQALNLKRMVYINVPGDSYQMKDMNDQSGLAPKDGSSGRHIYFQHPKYLDYLLIVNEGSKHTSMDFACYHTLSAWVEVN
ncbi:hypothetical protein [Winogradskyella sp.]|uniref:hypothetical protein n=1 Tax=Winogradskyella sp. TaxID=1883156 RepID=UPI0025CEA380|nr:hypothetical protein [Winogradskyella sp.]